MKIRNFIKAVSLVLTTSIVFGIAGTTRVAAAGDVSLSGTSSVQKYGEINGDWDASSSTLTLKSRENPNDPIKPIEAIKVNLDNASGFTGLLRYSVYVQSKGWQEYKTAGEEAGIANKALRIEALKMELTGDLADNYTVQYAVVLEKDGNVQGFVSDGAVAGTIGETKKIEQIKIRIVKAGTGKSTDVNYRGRRDGSGWGTKWSNNGGVTGAAGKGKPIDSIELNVSGNQYKGGITYRTYKKDSGWDANWSSNGETSGIQGKKINAIAVKLTGEVANHYDVYYRVYVPEFGWLDWAKNGETAGTTDLPYSLEAIQVILVAKGGKAPGEVDGIKSNVDISVITPGTPILPGRGIFKMPEGATVSYAVKSADGWSKIVSDGEVLDVSAPITGIAVGVKVDGSNLQLYADKPYFGDDVYDETDSYDAKFDLNIIDAGKNIESVRMALYYGWYYYDEQNNTEEFYSYNDEYSIFYRVKTSKYGWMAWTKDGLRCGTDELGNTISAIQIVVLKKGQTPDPNLNKVTSDTDKSVLRMNDFPKQKIITTNNAFAAWCLKKFPESESVTNYINANYHKRGYYYYQISSTWPYKLGGKSKKGADCTGFAVWLFKNYHKKTVRYNSHYLAFKTGKVIAYKNIKPGDMLCDCSTYHGDIFFYCGKDEYGHDIIFDGMTPKIGGKIKYVVPCFRYLDVEEWAKDPKHYLKRK